MKTRPAVEADLPALEAIFRAAIAGIADALYPPEQKQSWMNRSGRSLAAIAGGNDLTVILENGHAVGFYAQSRDASVIELLYIHPDSQGKGLARQAIAACMQTARMRCVPIIRTNASLASYPLFLKMGFIDGGRCYTERDGLKIPYYPMHAAL